MNVVKRFYDYTHPDEKAKCRERQKIYYHRRLNTVIECIACNENYNDFYIHQHIKSKKHQKNAKRLIDNSTSEKVIIAFKNMLLGGEMTRVVFIQEYKKNI